MKIQFKTFSTINVNLEYLLCELETEGFGYNDRSGETAVVVVVDSGIVTCHNPKQPKLSICDRDPSVRDSVEALSRGINWIACGDRYTLISSRMGEQVWEYEGESSTGFLGRSLLPEVLHITEPCVTLVEGVHGRFEGSDAIEKYCAQEELNKASERYAKLQIPRLSERAELFKTYQVS